MICSLKNPALEVSGQKGLPEKLKEIHHSKTEVFLFSCRVFCVCLCIWCMCVCTCIHVPRDNRLLIYFKKQNIFLKSVPGNTSGYLANRKALAASAVVVLLLREHREMRSSLCINLCGTYSRH